MCGAAALARCEPRTAARRRRCASEILCGPSGSCNFLHLRLDRLQVALETECSPCMASRRNCQSRGPKVAKQQAWKEDAAEGTFCLSLIRLLLLLLLLLVVLLLLLLLLRAI